jgi:hypothetical protein
MLPMGWLKQQAAGQMTVIYRHVKMMLSFDMSLKTQSLYDTVTHGLMFYGWLNVHKTKTVML